MDKAERFRRVRALFDEATALPSEQRAIFVHDHSDGDESIRAEVMRLLASVDSANQGGFLGEAAWKRAPAEAPVKTGTWFGPYRVVKQLSSGGMGSVYLVVRADDVYRRQAALKVIRPDCLTEELVRRFHRERQILAELDHPNIARIVDGGTTSAGLPYFVMDYVEGQHLNAFCTQRRLHVEARLQLFGVVCRAVEYLHRNRIVHRDLKPSNILVSANGTVKLVDFGIAKILTESQDATRTAPLLTPSYASPEQLMNQPVSPASDVYSLGVVLYELLTGRRPFQREEAASGANPPVPSSVAGTSEQHVTPENPAQLRRRLTGDLDTILLMSLRREPERRYTDAGAFALDIERHLAGQPVSAQPDTVVYRGGKFLRRNRLAAVAAVVLLGVSGWGVNESLERRRLEKRVEALQEETRRAMATAESRLLADDSASRQSSDLENLAKAYRGPFVEAMRLAPGRTTERDALVGRAERYLGRVAELFGRNLGLQREVAAGYLLLGRLRGDPGQPNMGDRAGALRLYQRAREMAAQSGDNPLTRDLLQLIQQHESRAAMP